MDKLSYALGLGIGNQLASMGAENINIEDFSQAISDMLAGRKPQVDEAESRTLLTDFFAEVESKRSAGQQDFLAENGKRAEVTTLPSGLQYEVLKAGNGKQAKATDKVRCHYEGQLVDGSIFDSSVRRGEPAVFGVNQVIAGWVEALQLMQEGAKWKLYIPSELGYGARGAGESIPPHATLIFEVELLEVL